MQLLKCEAYGGFSVPVKPVWVAFVMTIIFSDSQTPQSHKSSLHCCHVLSYK